MMERYSYDWWNLYCNLAYFLMYHLLAGVLLKIKNRKFLIATLKIDLFLCKNITSDIGFNVFLSTLSKKTVNSCQDCQSIFCDISQEILFGFQWHGKYVILSNKLHSNVILNKSYWFFSSKISIGLWPLDGFSTRWIQRYCQWHIVETFTFYYGHKYAHKYSNMSSLLFLIFLFQQNILPIITRRSKI